MVLLSRDGGHLQWARSNCVQGIWAPLQVSKRTGLAMVFRQNRTKEAALTAEACIVVPQGICTRHKESQAQCGFNLTL